MQFTDIFLLRLERYYDKCIYNPHCIAYQSCGTNCDLRNDAEWLRRDEGIAASGLSCLLCRPISIMEHTYCNEAATMLQY